MAHLNGYEKSTICIHICHICQTQSEIAIETSNCSSAVGPGVFTLRGRDPEPGQRESLCGGIGSSIHAALAGAPMTWRFYKLCE